MLATLLLTLIVTLRSTDSDTTLRLPRGGAVEIETHTRRIIVRTGAGDLVTIRGGQAELDGRTLTINADDLMDTRAGVLEVTLPVWARTTIGTRSGSIVVESAPDRLEAETLEGAIHVTGGTGVLDLQSVAGAITVENFKGTRVSIDATGDDVTITNATGRIEVSSVNGAIRLHGIHSSFIEASTVNGGVDFEGPLAADGQYRFESHSGGITMTLPGDVSARLKVSTYSSKFYSQIPATRSADSDDGDQSEFTATLGKGEARVVVESFNGAIRVIRAVAR